MHRGVPLGRKFFWVMNLVEQALVLHHFDQLGNMALIQAHCQVIWPGVNWLA